MSFAIVPEIRVLDEHAIPLLDERVVLDAVRSAFVELARGRAVQPAQTVTMLPDGGDMITYTGVLADAGVIAVKLSPYLPRSEGQPVITAWTLLLSTTTGAPIALLDSALLTTERTAATTALAIDLLARPDARSLAVVGSGPVARAHLRYARLVRGVDDIRIFGRSGVSHQASVEFGGDVHVVERLEDAVAGADVVVLCTSAAEAVIDAASLPPGTLVTSVSTNAPGAREIDPAALGSLDVFCDHTPSASLAAGEFVVATADGSWHPDAIVGDLAGLIRGSAVASGERPVFFRSIGLGIEDAAIALVVLASIGASPTSTNSGAHS